MDFPFEAYKGITLLSTEVDVLTELEHQVGEPIPPISYISWITFGFTAENNNVTDLGLYSQELKSLPESFGNLTNLKELYLHYNQLNTLPESFGQLQNLRTLFLHSNQLQTLPESFGNLTNLERLSLSHNQLVSLSGSFGVL
ncbi:MAG: leucine-rich repeat domain-containing protein, partial [Promethearchaeota archaeon]